MSAAEPLSEPVASPAEAGAAKPAERRLLGGDAQIIAWACIAILDSLVIVRTISLPRNVLIRVFHHIYAGGHALALGLASAAVVDVWRRVRPSPAPPGASRRD